MAILLLAWLARTNPAISFLPRDGRADWIVFPSALDPGGHLGGGVDATFRREFVLNNAPVMARLSIRAMRRVGVKINDALVLSQQPGRNWKEITSVDVSRLLHAGTNVIEARVFNPTGPPALWLNLTTDQLILRSDESWEVSIAGSSWRHAVLAAAAKTPGPGNPIAGGESTLDAMQKIWPFCILLIGIASVATFLWNISFKKSTPRWLEPTLLFVIAGLWLLLFWNNVRLLPFHTGFDAKTHLQYIDYIQEHRALPMPTDGWEMYQPPLYYLIAAASLSVGKLSTSDAASIVVLRFLGAFFGIAQFVLVFLSLRLLLPLRAAFIGLLLAAFLPMHLYVAHYVTNEMLAATLVTATLYLCLRLLKSDTPRASQFVWIGLTLGAAMLAKATGILLLPIVIAAVAAKLASARPAIVISLRNLGLLIAVCFAVCGWHYARIWLRFGTPLVGNWDAVSGFIWSQGPGYHVTVDYLRFGRSLVHPLFSSFAGFPDGIYSTLWGDGLCGGISSLNSAWNHQLLVAGYLWALIPTALLLTGAVGAIVQFIRNPSNELFLLLGFFFVLVLGLIFMTLKVPSYAQAKAFYAMSAITPLCFFGALGWETLGQGSKRLRFVLSTLVIAWALNSFATYWIVPSVEQHLYVAKDFASHGQFDQAVVEAAKAVDLDPSAAIARGSHALALIELGRDDEAINEAERAIELKPDDSDGHLDLAISTNRSNLARAVAEARRAIELGSENFSAYEFLMNCLLESHNYTEAADLAREWLAVAPYAANAHFALGSALVKNGDLKSAARHLGYLMMLRPEDEQAHANLRQILLSLAKESDGLQQLREIAANAPDSPRMLDELAWLLATYPDSDVRDGVEAVRLAERACKLTERRVPALLATLAAAYAETGDFSRGVTVAEEALRKAHAMGDTDGVKLSENILMLLRAGVPYRHKPEE